MNNNNAGAGILSIITESLYDNPIVVFREYVQNSVDSILKTENPQNGLINIRQSENDLIFLDNGAGIESTVFKEKMIKIGSSTKVKQTNLGYKGIGRLSGIPYCKKLIFINITDFDANKYQTFTIDSTLYADLKKSSDFSSLSWDDLISTIGKCDNEAIDVETLHSFLQANSEQFKHSNSGFLVVLKDISLVLKSTIDDSSFFRKLQWLLPVDFDNELYQSENKELFKELTCSTNSVPPITCCNIHFNGTPILRPINTSMLRRFTCKSDYKYAIGFHSFSSDKFVIDKQNDFSGIRIYIDNMLLCDEKELLQSLDSYGLLEHTSNGQLQSVRSIGAMIYITDKVNISANARRTFIEVTDADSIEFLKHISFFVNTIYDTRYALSNYASAKANLTIAKEKLQQLKEVALDNLKALANETIILPTEQNTNSFESMNEIDKKKMIKKAISTQINQSLKEYIKSLEELELESAFVKFKEWLIQQ